MCMRNKEARLKLQVLYGCRCLLTNIETDKLHYHHIKKKEHGGITTVANGAPLIKEIHQWLHSLEHTDIELYHLVNECLTYYKYCLDIEHSELINQFESECVPEFKKKVFIK